MNQKDLFLSGEGNQWFRRNAQVLRPERDEYVALLTQLQIKPQQVLEIGCANGFHLEALRQTFNAQVHGIDPSAEAVAEGNKAFGDIKLSQGTANQLPYDSSTFDLVILGFCLYLCDRTDLFQIAHEVDRVLKDGGFLLIKDFCPPIAYRNAYGHQPGIYSYKMNYSQMFTWNPAYEVVYFRRLGHAGSDRQFEPDEQIATHVIRKNLATFELDNPYR